MSQSVSPVLILCCVDYRYIDAILRFARKRLGVKAYDVKTDAGGVKVLLNGDPAVRAWIMSNLKLAYNRHGVRTVILVHHEDCAAYGGKAAFKSQADEALFHAKQLTLATTFLQSSFRRLGVRAFYSYQDHRGIVFKEVGRAGSLKVGPVKNTRSRVKEI